MSMALSAALRLFSKKSVQNALKDFKGVANEINQKGFEGGLSSFSSFLSKFTNLDIALKPFTFLMNQIKASTTQDSVNLMKETMALIQSDSVQDASDVLKKLLHTFISDDLTNSVKEFSELLTNLSPIISLFTGGDSNLTKLGDGLSNLDESLGFINDAFIVVKKTLAWFDEHPEIKQTLIDIWEVVENLWNITRLLIDPLKQAEVILKSIFEVFKDLADGKSFAASLSGLGDDLNAYIEKVIKDLVDLFGQKFQTKIEDVLIMIDEYTEKIGISIIDQQEVMVDRQREINQLINDSLVTGPSEGGGFSRPDLDNNNNQEIL